MPTDNEKKALWFLAAVALSGGGVRLYRSAHPELPAPDTAALAVHLRRVDSARKGPKSRAAAAAKPASSQPLDLDRASAEDIEALPGIGPALARRIVANRDSAGAFGHLEALCGVRGIGPAMRERLRPLVTFTGARRPVSDECGGASQAPGKARARRARQ